MLYLPEQNWRAESRRNPPSSVVPKETLERTASTNADVQLTVAAANSPIRILYGRRPIGALILNALDYEGQWVVQCVFGEAMDAIEQIYFNDEVAPSSVAATHYTGYDAAVVDPTLAAAFAAKGITYTDTLSGLAYSVLKFPAEAVSGFPQISAMCRGRRIYDPRTSLTVYSDNPSLCLADFCVNTLYGAGRSVDWDSVAAAANANDELVSGQKRRRMALLLGSAQSVWSWIDTLRTYACCWVVPRGSTLVFVPDRPGDAVASYAHEDADFTFFDPIKYRGIKDIPTVIELRYTATDQMPWRDESVWAYAPGVLAGTTPYRHSQVSLIGIFDASQAMREAQERLNKLWLTDASYRFGVKDKGLAQEAGDIVLISHPAGPANKPVRLLDKKGAYGRYAFACVEYQPDVYSDATASEPTYPDTDQPDPTTPPSVSGLAMVEEHVVLKDETTVTRFRLSWDEPEWAYLKRYRVELWVSGVLFESGSTNINTWVSKQLTEGDQYEARVYVVSATGHVSETPAVATATAQGKSLRPTDVPAIRGFEAGGRVYLAWDKAVDVGILRYQVRRWQVGQAWEDGTTIDEVDSLRLDDDQTPVGTWVFGVKAIDSVGLDSQNAATVTLSVTSDASSFLIDTLEQTNPTLTNMVEYSLAPSDTNRYFVTDDGVDCATKFPAATMGSYPDVLCTYHNSVTSTWLGESEDFGKSLSGNWSGTASVETIGGSLLSYLGLSDDGSEWTYSQGLSKKANSRFARMKHEALTTSTMKVTVPSQSIRIDAVPSTEVGSGTSSASGPVSVILTNSYASAKTNPIISPTGTTQRVGIPDRLCLCLYDDFAGKRALQFGGDSNPNYVTVPNYAGIQINTGTLELLVWADITPAAGSADVLACHHEPYGDPGGYNFWFLGLTPSNGYARAHAGAAGNLITLDGSVSLCDSTWHRMSLVFYVSGGSTYLDLYVDGVYVGSTSYAAAMTAPSGIFAIGARPPRYIENVYVQHANARIADVRVWNTQRTAQQIADKAFRTLVGNEAGLVGYWPLNESSGTTAANLVSGGNSGTHVASPQIAGMNGFDAYVFENNLKIASPFTYEFFGV